MLGVDNDLRSYFFWARASTAAVTARLVGDFDGFEAVDADIRDRERIESLFAVHRPDLVIHCAAQPSHDWAASEPHTDFGVTRAGRRRPASKTSCARYTTTTQSVGWPA